MKDFRNENFLVSVFRIIGNFGTYFPNDFGSEEP